MEVEEKQEQEAEEDEEGKKVGKEGIRSPEIKISMTATQERLGCPPAGSHGTSNQNWLTCQLQKATITTATHHSECTDLVVHGDEGMVGREGTGGALPVNQQGFLLAVHQVGHKRAVKVLHVRVHQNVCS